MIEVSIVSTCFKKPSRVVTNLELEKKLGLGPGIIERLTGIQSRNYLGQNESLPDLATDACFEAIQKSKLDPSDLDMIIFYTDVPPTMLEEGCLKKTYYEIAPHIQFLLREKGATVNCECINIGGSCVAFISALQIACGLIKSGSKKNIVIIGAANCSSFLGRAEKNVAMTFSDGAAATILAATPRRGFLDFYCMTDGAGYDSGVFKDYEELYIDRKRVAEFAPRAFQSAIRSLFEKTKLGPDNFELFIPHQAGLKIIERGIKLAEIPREKVFICLQSDGNTGAPAIQIALTRALEEGRIKEGNLIALVGFGTGWHYGATAFYFHQNPQAV
jgi:3-oxoacyl-[acyl-carrier-protein] synthase-3